MNSRYAIRRAFSWACYICPCNVWLPKFMKRFLTREPFRMDTNKQLKAFELNLRSNIRLIVRFNEERWRPFFYLSWNTSVVSIVQIAGSPCDGDPLKPGDEWTLIEWLTITINGHMALGFGSFHLNILRFIIWTKIVWSYHTLRLWLISYFIEFLKRNKL